MIKNLLQEAFILKEKGFYKNSIEIFYKVLNQDSSVVEVLYDIAELYYLMNNEERALSYIEQILVKNPKHIDALKLLKQIFVERQKYQEAEQTAKNIYCISNSNKDLIEIFKLLNMQGKYKELFEYQYYNRDNQILLELAKAAFSIHDYEKSESYLQNITADSELHQEALLLLGKVYYAANKKHLCIELLNDLYIDEKNHELLNFVGLVKVYQGDYKSAINLYHKSIKQESSNARYYYNLANAYFYSGNTSLAKKYYNMAISLEPKNQGYYLALANMYYAEKQYKKALEQLTEDFFESKLLKAIILYETGYLALSSKEFDKLKEIQPENCVIKEYKEKISKELGLTS